MQWPLEFIFLLQQDNVIHQALLDSWGESNNSYAIYILITVPLHSLQVTYSGTYDVWPLSNAYKNQITQFWDMYDCCNYQAALSDHNIFYLTSSHFDRYCSHVIYT